MGVGESNSAFQLLNAAVPDCLRGPSVPPRAQLALTIERGLVTRIEESRAAQPSSLAKVDACGGIVTSALVDCHTHLDKAHLAAHRDFPAGDLMAAINAMEAAKTAWSRASLEQRVRFSLDRALSHGVRAIRSHVDYTATTPAFVAPAMRDLRAEARDRGIDLQLAPLIPLELVDDADWLDRIAASCPAMGGVIGFFVFKHNCTSQRLDRVFQVAREHDLMLDFHVDEGLDPALDGLSEIVRLARSCRLSQPILCGHNVSLATRQPDQLNQMLDAIAGAQLTLVMLPHPNLYLQDREPGRTPRHRGVMPFLEAHTRGIPVAIGTDNVRDGFYPYGDHDPLEALALAATAAQVPDPLGAFASTITTTPAKALGLDWDGLIKVGAPADLVVFDGRTSSEVIASLGRGRRIIRDGAAAVSTQQPNYRLLDRGLDQEEP